MSIDVDAVEHLLDHLEVDQLDRCAITGGCAVQITDCVLHGQQERSRPARRIHDA